MSEEAREVWASLFTNKLLEIWVSEPKELRRATMIVHVLMSEFKAIQCTLDNEISTLKDKLKLRNYYHEECYIQEKENYSPNLKINSPEIGPLHRHKIIKIDDSPPRNLLNKTQVVKSPIINKSQKYSPRNRRKTTKFSLNLNHTVTNKNDEVIDCSIIETTPPINKKSFHVPKPKIKKNMKSKQSSTLTQMFSLMPNTTEVSDETEMDVTVIKENSPQVDFSTFIDEYDIIPVMKSSSPDFIHQTEPIRGKAERMKLKGWSCEDCKKFYEGLNLPPEEIKKKMNECSKHRYKFGPPADTPPGFWDLDFPETQD